MKKIKKITPCLWFDSQAEEAVNYYVSVFSENINSSSGGNDSRIKEILRYDKASSKASGMPENSVLTLEFELEGERFIALNGGPHFKFSGAVSFVVNCDSQEEIDYFWEKLSEGGEVGECGWINRDKFGLTWQVVPTILDKYLSDPDPKKARRVMEAMLKMKKIIIKDLREAYQGE